MKTANKNVFIFLIKNLLLNIVATIIIVQMTVYILKIDLLPTERIPLLIAVAIILSFFSVIYFFQGKKLSSGTLIPEAIKDFSNEEEVGKESNIEHEITTSISIPSEPIRNSNEEQTTDLLKEITHSIFRAQEKERRTVSRELQDGIGQSLLAMLIHTDILKTLIRQEGLQKHLEKLQLMIQQTIEDVRKLSSVLRPATLDEHGLVASLKNYNRELSTRFGMQINFTYKGNSKRFDSAIETGLYRIAQEALTNAAKYSCAERVDVVIDTERNGNEIYMSITDFGNGFEWCSANRKSAGIYSMEERTRILGGKFSISSEVGQGTTIQVSIPLRQE